MAKFERHDVRVPGDFLRGDRKRHRPVRRLWQGPWQIGTPAGGFFQAFSNSSSYYPGQIYIDCGDQSTSAIFFRTGNSATRLSITHDSDSVFVPPSNTGRGLVVRGASLQSGDLQQWQNSSNSPLVAVRADGNLASAKTQPAIVLGHWTPCWPSTIQTIRPAPRSATSRFT